MSKQYADEHDLNMVTAMAGGDIEKRNLQKENAALREQCDDLGDEIAELTSLGEETGAKLRIAEHQRDEAVALLRKSSTAMVNNKKLNPLTIQIEDTQIAIEQFLQNLDAESGGGE